MTPTTATTAPHSASRSGRLELTGRRAWAFVGVAAAAAIVLWVLGQLWIVLLPLVIGVLLTRALEPLAARLRGRLGDGVSALVALVAFLLVVTVALGALGRAMGSQLDDLGTTVSSGVDDVERWLVDDAPLDLTQADVDRARERAGEAAGRWLRTSGDSVVAGVALAGEVVLSVLIGLIVTFFMLKDGRRFTAWVQRRLPENRRDLSRALGARAWTTLGGYLRGAALLGLIEGVVAAVTLTLVGAELAVPVGLLTFALAFVPFAGAAMAGIVAVLVALATAGGGGAVVVAVVMLVVQQLDNDLLSPVVYGTQLSVHPLVILLSIVGGGALFGVAGSVLAVPVVAVAYNLVAEAAHHRQPRDS